MDSLKMFEDIGSGDKGMVTMVMAGVATLLSILYLSRKRSQYPPGPLALPLIGNIHQILLIGSVMEFCEKYRRIYGNVFSMKIGSHTRVVVSGYEAMHELLIKNADHTSGRSMMAFPTVFRERFKSRPGIFWAPFPHWKNIRTFSLMMLKDGGMGKAAFEPQITEEVERYIQTYIQPYIGQPIDLQYSLPKATANVVSQLVFGQRFDYDDKDFEVLTQAVNEGARSTARSTVINNIPLISRLMTSARDRNVIAQAVPVFEKLIKENKKNLDANNPRCLLDQLLLSGDSLDFYSEGNTLSLVTQLFNAGTETSSTTLKWAMLYLCDNPEVILKVQQEIDQNIGQRPPTYKDRLTMPYTDAVLLEVQRLSNIVNSSLPHLAEKDFNIDGKVIPAGSDLLLNMASVLYDEKVFEEPSKFKPERYLTGDISLKKQRTIPFGIGRRTCLGESLAKVELFLFFVNFLQKYDIKLPEGSKVNLAPTAGIITLPQPYDIIFTPRE